MKYYIVVEGKCGERIVYPPWISYVNEALSQTHNIDDDTNDSFYLISGNGYPNYLNIIDNAIDDINAKNKFDCLVVAVDAEEDAYQDKYDEIFQHVGDRLKNAQLKIIIQHPCLEAWALGNRVVFRRHPENENLRRYLKIFNVRVDDPESIPSLPSENLNRAQFAFSYLKCILTDRYPKLIYTKSNPRVLVHEKYFEQIRKRLEETQHIKSFKAFLDVFEYPQRGTHAP
jgi:hypothetical protein